MRLLSYIIRSIFDILSWLIVIRTLISWLAPDIHHPNWRKFLRLLYRFTEPILGPIRENLPVIAWGLDFTPLVALLLLSIMRTFVLRIIMYLALDLGLY
ncbi:MAG: YggT family protein [Halanaerobiaceae bacterium]|nr:YggT family protein [Halanaerobiaceae bacterium]